MLLQGCLAQKKQRPPGTLHQDGALLRPRAVRVDKRGHARGLHAIISGGLGRVWVDEGGRACEGADALWLRV